MEMTWLETIELLGIDLLAALLLAVVVLDLLEHGMHAVGLLHPGESAATAGKIGTAGSGSIA